MLGTRQAPWFTSVTPTQWRAFLAAYLGWLLDGFDFAILTFLLVDIQRHFGVTSALVGLLGTAPLLLRVVGGVTAGTAADRWGRKGPLMASILAYSAFAFLGGFSTSYAMLLACRALFGIGMGGVWAAGMPLALEHWPARLRGVASGLVQGGYAMGSILAAAVYQFVYPLLADRGDGWRVLLWLGITPVALVVWIYFRVDESPVWLEERRQRGTAQKSAGGSFAQLFGSPLRWVTLHTTLLMATLLFLYQAITFWYPTVLVQMGRQTLPFLVAFNAGGVTGAFVGGRLSETSLGRRGAMSLVTFIGVVSIPLFLYGSNTAIMLIGAAAMGTFGTGAFGAVPSYLNERFPTAVRAGGAGFAYQSGAAVASIAPSVIGSLRDDGMALPVAMAISIAAAGVATIVLVWMGPETRGWRLGESTKN
jgi:SHS family lactate transporter-like MFS transporter